MVEREGLAGRIGRGCVAAAAAAALLPAVLAGCATPQQDKPDPQLLQLAALLPGHYDNSAQVEADMRAGRPPHAAVSVVIAPIDSLTVGEHAFYLQQEDAADPRRVTARIFALNPVRGAVVATLWALAEPGRWRGGAANPELFTALQYPDLKPLTGCQLVWKREATRFTATNDMAHCHATPPAAHGAISAHWQMELTSDTLAISERNYDADGKEVGGRQDDPFLRLRRVSVN